MSVQIVMRRGASALPRQVRRALARGRTSDEVRRAAQEASWRSERDRLLELIASKRSPALGGPWPESPVCRVLSDDAVLRMGEHAMERLFGGDRGRWGDGAILYESLVLTEAALALCGEAQRRGLIPHERAADLKAAIEGRLAERRAASEPGR